MSDAEGFLARWSRRKRKAAAQPEAAKAAPASDDTKLEHPAAAPIPAADLPSIESIDADSDITAFLGAGVPPDLARAALRRAWTTDPAIRDFVGLSENAWDFNAPDGVPGFGSLNPDQIRRLVQEMSREPEADAPTRPAEDPVFSPPAASAATPVPTPESDPPAPVPVAQNQAAPSPPEPAAPRLGSALPR